MANELLVTDAKKKKFQKAELFLILSEDCPFDKNSPSSCVLQNIRKKSQEKRMAWFDKLSEEAIRQFHTSCQLCWKKR